MLRILLILAPLFLLNSCILLSRSDIINHDESETISLVSLEIIYDGKHETRNHSPSGFCQVRFHDDEFNAVKFRNEEHSPFYFLKTEPGRIILEEMKCMHHVIPLFYLKNRKIDLSEWGFVAHKGFVNYIGHVVITYRPKGFHGLDLFALGGIKTDRSGKFEVRVEDRIDDAVIFLNRNYPELKNVPVTKSLLTDISQIKYNVKPEAYKIGAPKPAPAPAPTEVKKEETVSTYEANPYYTPLPPQATPYENPYQTQPAAQ